ncbi:MAG: radical SAM protein [Desulfobulbaceae bacterium]|nr:radical SAM protein [Desulfobulbaceae bacterium]
MRKRRVGIIQLARNTVKRKLHTFRVRPSFGGIMSQAVAVWCEKEGHEVTLVVYTGVENFFKVLPNSVDIVFIDAFTQSAQLAYALSNLFQTRGAVTVLGGPHARCYPEDAQQYFDYVLGLTDQEIIRTVLNDCSPHRPLGQWLSAESQPTAFPGVRERWKFIENGFKRSLFMKAIPILGSVGCPYHCNFCIDSNVSYYPLDVESLKADLRFVTQLTRHVFGFWYDPNFGVRFDEYMDMIEEAVPPNSQIEFGAEMTLSLLSEPHLKRLKKHGVTLIVSGIESWQTLGQKTQTPHLYGREKVKYVSEHINMVLDYIPHFCTTFIFGFDSDEGDDPFELTRLFVDMAPGVYPLYNLLTAFGEAAPTNLIYQREGRVLPLPFHFMNAAIHALMNVIPKHYTWPEFYDHIINLLTHSFSWRAMIKRYNAQNSLTIPHKAAILHNMYFEKFQHIQQYRHIRGLLDTDPEMRAFLEGDTTILPTILLNRLRNDLGPLWQWLPEGAIYHDQNAYLKKQVEVKK